MRTRSTGLLSLIFCTLILSACVTTPEPTTRYYMLSSHNSDKPSGRTSPVVEIATLEIPRYLDRPQLVTRPNPNRLEIHEQDRWGDNLRKNLERVLADNLTQALDGAPVLLVPHLLPKVDVRLLVEIHQFERTPAEQVVLRAQWTLLKPGSGKPVRVKKLTLQKALPPSSGMDEIVTAMSELLLRFAAQIAQSIQNPPA